MFDAAMQKTELQVPPSDFTNQVMKRVQQVEIDPSFSYSSLLPKKLLWLIAVIIIGASGYFLFTGNFDSESWFEKSQIASKLSQIKLPSIEFAFSNTAVYAFVLLGIMVLVQTSLLKGYFDRRIV